MTMLINAVLILSVCIYSVLLESVIPTELMTITVQSSERQTFHGFGVSEVSDDIQTSPNKAQIQKVSYFF